MTEILITALVAILIALAIPYRWHRENKRARRVHDKWMGGEIPFRKWHERRKP